MLVLKSCKTACHVSSDRQFKFKAKLYQSKAIMLYENLGHSFTECFIHSMSYQVECAGMGHWKNILVVKGQ